MLPQNDLLLSTRRYGCILAGNTEGNRLQFGWWGKRTMTNDFAHVVHRIKALGFTAVRVQFV